MIYRYQSKGQGVSRCSSSALLFSSLGNHFILHIDGFSTLLVCSAPGQETASQISIWQIFHCIDARRNRAVLLQDPTIFIDQLSKMFCPSALVCQKPSGQRRFFPASPFQRHLTFGTEHTMAPFLVWLHGLNKLLPTHRRAARLVMSMNLRPVRLGSTFHRYDNPRRSGKSR